MHSLILIDNDKLIRLSWEMKAKDKKISLRTFKSIAEFVSASSDVSPSAQIFVDSNLDDGIKGEIASQVIYELGFKNISLATGDQDIEISNYPWISNKISKQPPY